MHRVPNTVYEIEEHMEHMKQQEKYRRIINGSWEKNCFGCSPNNPAGLQMEFYTDEKTVFSCLKVPDHLRGWNNLVHGGVIATILDETMGTAAIHLHKLIVLTKTMTIDFIQPIFIDDELKAEGRLTKFDNVGKVVIEGTLHNGKGELCAKSTGIFSYFSPPTIKKMGITDESSLKEFEIYIEK